jgi:hypothetical protein
MASKFPRECIERAARIYNTNYEAALALGIKPPSFGRLCRRYNILSPSDRRKRERGQMNREDFINYLKKNL